MNIKKIKPKNLILNSFICFLYPLIKLLIKNSLVAFSDSCFILGLILTLFGVFNSLILHGDFDIASYIAAKTIGKNKQEYQSFKLEAQEKRKDSVNYPLIIGILMLLISYISALFC